MVTPGTQQLKGLQVRGQRFRREGLPGEKNRDAVPKLGGYFRRTCCSGVGCENVHLDPGTDLSRLDNQAGSGVQGIRIKRTSCVVMVTVLLNLKDILGDIVK